MKLLSNLKSLEQQKHLKPMFSAYCNDLEDFIKNSQEMKFEKSIMQDNRHYTQLNCDLDFQILNDGLAYDDNRIQRFTPSKLETVYENPKSQNFSREKTQKLIYIKNNPLEHSSLKLNSGIKKRPKNIKNAGINCEYRTFTKIDHNISF